jgi:uncharacterized membrane protein
MPELHFNEQDRQSIVTAIERAEAKTSGEIQVHLEKYCAENVLDRAAEVFAMLEMHKTRLRNGVLFYLAIEDHKFAVIGDVGIHTKVADHYWERIKDTLREHFVAGAFTEGLCKGIEQVGETLKIYFPSQEDDQNELPNEISFGK